MTSLTLLVSLSVIPDPDKLEQKDFLSADYTD